MVMNHMRKRSTKLNFTIVSSVTECNRMPGPCIPDTCLIYVFQPAKHRKMAYISNGG